MDTPKQGRPGGCAPTAGYGWRRLCKGKWIYGDAAGWIFRLEDGTFECRVVEWTGKFRHGVEGAKLPHSNQPNKAAATAWVEAKVALQNADVEARR